MKPLPLFLSALLLAAPLSPPARAADEPASETPALPSEEELRALGEAAREMARRFAERLDPMLEKLRALAGDLTAYEAPELLPNGDIIIRRKPTPQEAPTPDPEGGVSL